MRSLRGRLTIGVLIVLTGALAIAGVTVSRYSAASEREAFDDRLKRTAELSRETALAAVQEELPTNDRRLDAVLDATDTSLRVLLGETTLLETGEPPPIRPRLGDGFRTFTAGGTRYRVYTVSLEDSDLGGLARLEVTSSLSVLERRVNRLERRVLLLSLIALAISGAGAWFAAELVLRPLRRLRAATTAIGDTDDLTVRVDDQHGTSETRALARSFNAMLARLGRGAADRERALEATRRFAADAGHELRTPLTAVQATLSALSRHPDIPVERRQAMIDDAISEQARLVALLDGLQALGRGDAMPAPREVDLAEVADLALEAVRARHPEIAFAVDLPDEPVVVSGWEPGLRSVVENLIENAARHGGSRVALALTSGAHPVLTVEDDGAGVPEEDRERIFEPFQRLDPERTAGSGLGLALVAQQAGHHGAKIIIDDSERLGGARFRVTF